MSIQLPLLFPPEVIWKDIPGYEGYYQASDTGVIRRIKYVSGKAAGILTPGLSAGYFYVNLCVQGKVKLFRIHRLVMLTFSGECPPGLVVNHKNGIKTDNSLRNLEYVTPKENVCHARDVLGTFLGAKSGRKMPPYTGRNGNLKLSAEKVREIRTLYASGVRQSVLAKMFEVGHSAIWYVISGRGWRHIK